jgi:hypothetical protein
MRVRKGSNAPPTLEQTFAQTSGHDAADDRPIGYCHQPLCGPLLRRGRECGEEGIEHRRIEYPGEPPEPVTGDGHRLGGRGVERLRERLDGCVDLVFACEKLWIVSAANATDPVTTTIATCTSAVTINAANDTTTARIPRRSLSNAPSIESAASCECGEKISRTTPTNPPPRE